MHDLSTRAEMAENSHAGIAGELIGKHVIIRSNGAGVHAGTLVAVGFNNSVRLRSSRRIWYRSPTTGHSLTSVAIHGIALKNAKLSEVLADIFILDAVEIIPTTAQAQASIEGARNYDF